MKGYKVIKTGYEPRPLQAELHKKLKRFNVLVCHRRFGKTVFCINHMIDRGLRNPLKNPRYAYLAPLYAQAKRVAWDYLKMYTVSIPGATPNEQDLRIDIPRPGTNDSVRFQLLGADNPVSLKGIYLDGVILDEYGEMNPTAWSEVIRPTLSDRLGWAVFIGTPKGQNSFYELHRYSTEGRNGVISPDWFGSLYKASQTGILSNAELLSAKETMTEDEYEQEFECSFAAALTGAYFGKELSKVRAEGRLTKVHYDPNFKVDTYWDLGINDTTAVWFCQSVRGRHRFIDYMEISGASIQEIMSDLQAKKYVYGQFVLPHDAKARDLSTGKSQMQIFYNLGARNLKVIPKVGTKRESINAARMAFAACEFDSVKCDKGIRALENYQRKWDAKNNVYQETPLHNWASNGADAFQQFALGLRDDSEQSEFEPQKNFGGKIPFHAEADFNPFA